jgi:S1-C subfamily serine protease
LALALVGAGCGTGTEQVRAPIATPAPPKQLTPKQIREKAGKSMVRVTVTDSLTDKKGGGSGSYLGNEKILTASHVVAGASKISVSFGDTRMAARVFADDPYNDIAILELESAPKGLVPLDLDKVADPVEGDNMMVFGYTASSLYQSGQSRKLVMRTGVVGATDLRSRVARHLPEYRDLFQSSAAIIGGNSGGLAYNDKGEPIGIPIAGNRENDENYAIRFGYVKELLPALLAGKSPASMQMQVAVFTKQEIAEILGMPWNWQYGLVVIGVKSGGPADKVGIEVGDLMWEAEGHHLRSVADLNEVMQSHARGDSIKLEGLFGVIDLDAKLRFEKRVKLK